MSSSGSQKRVFQHGHEQCRVDKDGDWEEMSSQTDSEEELLAAQRARYAEEEKDEVLDEIVGVLSLREQYTPKKHILLCHRQQFVSHLADMRHVTESSSQILT